MDYLYFSLSFSAIALCLFLIAKAFDKKLGMVAGLIFAAYLGLDDLVTALPSAASSIRLFDGEWNWSGKVFSLVLAVVFITALKINRRSSGLVLPYKNQTSSVLVTLCLITLSATLGVLFSPERANLETLLFQATMPGFAEEVAYRGIAPALMLGLIKNKLPEGKIPWLAILVTGLMFSVWHGLSLRHGDFSFDVIPASFTLIGGVAYGWLRFNSGSLLYPVVAHSAGNLIFQLTAFVGT